MFAYGGADVAFSGCEPHPYLLAEAALRALDRDRESQSFVISGESGSGKTETCKYILRYLSYRSKRRYEHSVSHSASDAKSNALEESVLMSNPILESFGNAKTTRNDNSSRWGKYTQVYVQPASGAIERVGITAYLLEKVRVIERFKNERNYHIFYQLVSALEAKQPFKPECGVDAIGTSHEAHAVLRDVEGRAVPPKKDNDLQTFKETRQAMKALAVDEGCAFLGLVAVVHLLDVKFEAETHTVEDTGAKVASTDWSSRKSGPKAIDAAAKALGVSSSELSEALVMRRVSEARVPRNDVEAEVAKQAFAKGLYSRLFAWILARTNAALKAMTGDQPQKMSREMFMEEDTKQPTEESLTIGLLDIFGFEAFETNSLEQLLINYANEKLLQEFNKQVFEAATKEYAAEGVEVGDLTYKDNTALISMLDNPKNGIFATLNSECVRRDGNDPNFLSTLLKIHVNGASASGKRASPSKAAPATELIYVPKVNSKSTKAERDRAGAVFGVKHFAAKVTYSIANFVEKNRDRLPDEICQLVAMSDQPFIAALFGDVADDDEKDVGEKSPAPRSPVRGAPGAKKKQTRYVAAAFAESLQQLTQLLDETSQSFVRCIKPNHKAMARTFQGSIILEQLRCMGMLELVEARRRGYARRSDHGTFVSRYALLLESEEDDGEAKEKKKSSDSYSFMAMISGGETKKNGGDDTVSHEWEKKGGSPAVVKEFLKALKDKKLIPKPDVFDSGLAIGKTKVFMKRQSLDVLESLREERLKRDVLLALGEATEARDAMQLELTLRIADELRLGETDEARLARATLTDERAFQDIYVAVIELCDEGKVNAVDEAFAKHNIPLAGDGDIKVGDGKAASSAELPFAGGQWFSGSTWSVYVEDCSRVGRTARTGVKSLADLEGDTTEDAIALGKAFVAAARKEYKTFEAKKEEEDSRTPPVDSLKALADKVEAAASKGQARLHIAASMKALRAAVASKKLAAITAALATLDKIPAVQAETLMTDKDDDAIAEARALCKKIEANDALSAEFAKLEKDTKSSSNQKSFVKKKDATKQIEALEAKIAAASALGAAALSAQLYDDANKLVTKLRDLVAAAQKVPAKKPEKKAPVPAPAVPAEPTPEEKQAAERKLARAKREESTRELEAEKEEAGPREARAEGPSDEMQALSEEEKDAIQVEEARRIQMHGVLFCDLPWATRVKILTKPTRILKLSSTSQVQGAEWKMVKLDTPTNPETGESVLCDDPTLSNDSSAVNASFITWPSSTLLRRGTRKLPIADITGVHVGTNAKQWCTMVPTEWHYMTISTKERSYDFGFESASMLLLWVNTLQRIVFPDWTRQCDAGEMSELFKGAISDAQHRFYRSARAGAGASNNFKPSLPELCPVLYPIAAKLTKTCAELGVSFAANAERAQKFCMWTAVAVLEAPVPHDNAVAAMRAVLSDLGFYAEGRFACSAGFYDENGLAHTLAKDAIASSAATDKNSVSASESGMLVIRAQHAKTGKVSVLKIKKGTKMASVFEAHAKHKGLRTQALSVVK